MHRLAHRPLADDRAPSVRRSRLCIGLRTSSFETGGLNGHLYTETNLKTFSLYITRTYILYKYHCYYLVSLHNSYRYYCYCCTYIVCTYCTTCGSIANCLVKLLVLDKTTHARLLSRWAAKSASRCFVHLHRRPCWMLW